MKVNSLNECIIHGQNYLVEKPLSEKMTYPELQNCQKYHNCYIQSQLMIGPKYFQVTTIIGVMCVMPRRDVDGNFKGKEAGISGTDHSIPGMGGALVYSCDFCEKNVPPDQKQPIFFLHFF